MSKTLSDKQLASLVGRDRRAIAKAVARLLRDAERQRERLDKVRGVGDAPDRRSE